MKSFVLVAILALLSTTCTAQSNRVDENWLAAFNKTTAERISEHGYPVETHYVETSDNYVIRMFRIPYSHNLQNQNEHRPAVLLQHGLTSCSDGWVLNGPNDALAFLFADTGYDVWLGNARGTRYSRNNTRISTKHPFFWQFTWHEIGNIDMPAMIDHIIKTTGQERIHYVGHSQGTTVFYVMMATRPEYNQKIKTAHLLAPVAFMSNMTTVWAKYTRRFIGRPNMLTRLLDTQEVLPSTLFFLNVYDEFCRGNSLLEFMCSNIYYIINGDNGAQMNETVALHFNETHPAGCSTSQPLHYMQEYESGRFCQFDHGVKENMKRYGQPTPPDYDISQITVERLHLYYSDADVLTNAKDIEYMASVLPKQPKMFRVPDPTFEHSDFIFSKHVKAMINDRLIEACNLYEIENANEIK